MTVKGVPVFTYWSNEEFIGKCFGDEIRTLVTKLGSKQKEVGT